MLLFLVLLIMFPTAALAAEATATSPVQDILTSIMQLVALILAGLVAWAVKLLAAKFKLTISAEQEAMVRRAAQDAVLYAEEWGANRLKLGEKATAGSDKLTQATTFMLTKIPGLDSDAAQKAIQAALGGILGMGASKTVGTSPVGKP